jgi:hypothetical protein
MRFNKLTFLLASGILSANMAWGQILTDSAFKAIPELHASQHVNAAKTYAIIYNRESGSTTNYSIVKLTNNEIVLKGSLSNGGYVRFLNNTTIQIFNVPSSVRNIIDSVLFKRIVFLERR